MWRGVAPSDGVWRDAVCGCRAIVWAMSVVGTLCCGCTYLDSLVLFGGQGGVTEDYVLIVPAERAGRDYVAQFAAFKEGQGYRVSVLTFDTGLPVDGRIAQVRELLNEARPAAGQRAYALILAADEGLPLGPWRVAGVEAPIRSDLPLFLAGTIEPAGPQERAGTIDRTTTLAAADWAAGLEPDFPWVFGRLPFSDDAVLSASLAATEAFAQRDRATTPLALLGAETFRVASDSALVMNEAKARFQLNQWQAELYATDPPADVVIDPAAVGGAAAAQLLFVERWSRGSPEVVYVISHSNWLGELDGRRVEGLGDYLLSTEAFAAIRDESAGIGRPASPAVLVTTGCSTGAPDNALLEVLFAKGWVVAFIGSTETNGPLPLVAAVRSEVHMGDVLSRGLPLGPALRAVEWTYYADALGPVSWI